MRSGYGTLHDLMWECTLDQCEEMHELRELLD